MASLEPPPAPTKVSVRSDTTVQPVGHLVLPRPPTPPEGRRGAGKTEASPKKRVSVLSPRSGSIVPVAESARSPPPALALSPRRSEVAVVSPPSGRRPSPSRRAMSPGTAHRGSMAVGLGGSPHRASTSDAFGPGGLQRQWSRFPFADDVMHIDFPSSDDDDESGEASPKRPGFRHHRHGADGDNDILVRQRLKRQLQQQALLEVQRECMWAVASCAANFLRSTVAARRRDENLSKMHRVMLPLHAKVRSARRAAQKRYLEGNDRPPRPTVPALRRALPLLQGLPDAAFVDALSNAACLVFDPGEVVMAEGVADAIFFVHSGRVVPDTTAKDETHASPPPGGILGATGQSLEGGPLCFEPGEAFGNPFGVPPPVTCPLVAAAKADAAPAQAPGERFQQPAGKDAPPAHRNPRRTVIWRINQKQFETALASAMADARETDRNKVDAVCREATAALAKQSIAARVPRDTNVARRCPLLRRFPRDRADATVAAGTPAAFIRGEVLWERGDPAGPMLFLCVEGTVEVKPPEWCSGDDSGSYFVDCLIGTGSATLLGHGPHVLPMPHTDTATVVSPYAAGFLVPRPPLVATLLADPTQYDAVRQEALQERRLRQPFLHRSVLTHLPVLQPLGGARIDLLVHRAEAMTVLPGEGLATPQQQIDGLYVVVDGTVEHHPVAAARLAAAAQPRVAKGGDRSTWITVGGAWEVLGLQECWADRWVARSVLDVWRIPIATIAAEHAALPAETQRAALTAARRARMAALRAKSDGRSRTSSARRLSEGPNGPSEGGRHTSVWSRAAGGRAVPPAPVTLAVPTLPAINNEKRKQSSVPPPKKKPACPLHSTDPGRPLPFPSRTEQHTQASDGEDGGEGGDPVEKARLRPRLRPSRPTGDVGQPQRGRDQERYRPPIVPPTPRLRELFTQIDAWVEEERQKNSALAETFLETFGSASSLFESDARQRRGIDGHPGMSEKERVIAVATRRLHSDVMAGPGPDRQTQEQSRRIVELLLRHKDEPALLQRLFAGDVEVEPVDHSPRRVTAAAPPLLSVLQDLQSEDRADALLKLDATPWPAVGKGEPRPPPAPEPSAALIAGRHGRRESTRQKRIEGLVAEDQQKRLALFKRLNDEYHPDLQQAGTARAENEALLHRLEEKATLPLRQKAQAWPSQKDSGRPQRRAVNEEAERRYRNVRALQASATQKKPPAHTHSVGPSSARKAPSLPILAHSGPHTARRPVEHAPRYEPVPFEHVIAKANAKALENERGFELESCQLL